MRSPALQIVLVTLLGTAGLAQSIGSTIEYRQRQWKILKQVTLGEAVRSFDVELLESVNATGASGNDEPMYDVKLLIRNSRRVVYESPSSHDVNTGFYMDDYLETKDVTTDGIPKSYFTLAS